MSVESSPTWPSSWVIVELTWFLAEDETHEAVLAQTYPTNALVTTNGKLDTFCHVAPFVCSTMPTRCDIRASGTT